MNGPVVTARRCWLCARVRQLGEMQRTALGWECGTCTETLANPAKGEDARNFAAFQKRAAAVRAAKGGAP